MGVLCSAEAHCRLTAALERLRCEPGLSLLLLRVRVTREEWLLEALIVCLDLLLASPSLKQSAVIISSSGVKCAVSDAARPGQAATRCRRSVEEEDPQTRQTRPLPDRDQSCPPTAGWRARLRLDQQAPAPPKAPMEPAVAKAPVDPKTLVACTIPSAPDHEQAAAAQSTVRKVAVVRKTSERRRRLETLNSESESESTTADPSVKRRKEKRRLLLLSHNCPPSKVLCSNIRVWF